MGSGLQGPVGSGEEEAQCQLTPTSPESVSDAPGSDRCRGGAELRPLCLWRRVQLGQKQLWAARAGRYNRYCTASP